MGYTPDRLGGDRCTWLHRHAVRLLDAGDGGAVLMERTGGLAGSPMHARALSDRLGGLPLALRAAGQYLAKTTKIPVPFADPGTIRTFADYYAALERGGASTLFPAITPDQARTLVRRTWELSLDLLADRDMPESRPLLRLLSCFAPAPIPYRLLLDRDVLASSPRRRGITGNNKVLELLDALAGLGLVDLHKPAGNDGHSAGWTVTLHPLVRDTNTAHPDVADDPAGFPTLAVRLLAAAANGDDTRLTYDPTRWQAFAPHAAYLRSVVNVPNRFPTEVVFDACRAACMAADYLRVAGHYESSEAELRAALTILRQVFGDEHLRTLAASFTLACVRYERGRPDEAEAEFRAVLATSRRVLGEEHPLTLGARHNLARVLHDRGHLDYAEAEHRAVLATSRRVLGDDYPDTLTGHHELARVLHDQGRFDEAEAEYRTVLAARQRVLGDDHPDTVATSRARDALTEAGAQGG